MEERMDDINAVLDAFFKKTPKFQERHFI